MANLGPVHCFLGIEIERYRSRRILHIHQQRAVRKLLATNGFSDFNGQWTSQPSGSKLQRLAPESNPTNGTARTLDSDGKQRYQSIVGSLMWLMLCTRPELAFTVSRLSKFSSTPNTEHLSAATYTLRYLRNTANLTIQYNASDSKANMPIGYTDSDFAGDPDDRKSTSGFVFMLAGGAITWRARKQPLVAFSMVEAEYISASDAAKEAIWVRFLYARILYGKILYKHAEQCPHCLCSDNDSKATEPQQIFVYNQGAIQLAKNPKFHERTKHISVPFHFARDTCERNAIKTTYLPTSNMLADIMTKNLPRDTHWKHAHGLGLVSRDSGEVADRPRVKRLK